MPGIANLVLTKGEFELRKNALADLPRGTKGPSDA